MGGGLVFFIKMPVQLQKNGTYVKHKNVVRPVLTFPKCNTYGDRWKANDGFTYRLVTLNQSSYKLFKEVFLLNEKSKSCVNEKDCGGKDLKGKCIGVKMVPAQWRELGVIMSEGWNHAM